jgi:hypothetical protein
MQTATIKIKGTGPLLQNNPQTVDRFNKYAKEMKKINDKKTRRTDEDYLNLRDLEVRSKIYFDDKLGIYVPQSWLADAIATNAFRVCKVSKDTIRGSLFVNDPHIKLQYRDMSKVKTPEDVVSNPVFHHTMILPQGQVRLVKMFPIFHDWSFETTVDFDNTMIDPDDLTRVVQHAARYGGFGDFRPTFGRASGEVIHG